MSRTHSAPRFVVGDFGATGDGRALQTVALQRAIDACAAKGGGTVVVTPGTYLTGGLVLRDRVTLYLEKGSTLLASADVADYPLKEGVPTALIFAERAGRMAIKGPGCIDGNGEKFWHKLTKPHKWAEDKKPNGCWVPHFDYEPKKRPRALILFSECYEIAFEDFLIRDSFHWTLLLMSCDHAVIRGVTMRTAVHGPNTDGIDLDSCQDVLVENCDILTGDDAVVLKSKGVWGLLLPSRNITVRGCALKSPTHGFTIGTETRDDFEDITFTDSTIERADGHRCNSGVDLSIMDGGAIRRVKVARIKMTDVTVPIQIRIGNAGRGQWPKLPGRIEDIEIKDVTATGALGVNLIAGLPEHSVHDVTLRNVHITAAPPNPAKVVKVVPEMWQEYPPGFAWLFLPARGFYCRHVKRLTLEKVTVKTSGHDLRPEFIFEDVEGLKEPG